MTRIRELRKARGWRQKDLAEALKISVMAVSHYEVGDREPDFETLRALGALFGVTADYILGWSSNPAPAISDEDAMLLRAFHAAPLSIQAAITTLLQPYQKEIEADQAI